MQQGCSAAPPNGLRSGDAGGAVLLLLRHGDAVPSEHPDMCAVRSELHPGDGNAHSADTCALWSKRVFRRYTYSMAHMRIHWICASCERHALRRRSALRRADSVAGEHGDEWERFPGTDAAMCVEPCIFLRKGKQN